MKMLDFIKQGTDRSVAVKKNIVGSLFVKGCSIIISLLIVPLTLGYVSSDLYGIWLTLSSIIMWLNFFDIGFTLGLKNKLTEAIALGDMQRGKVLVSTTVPKCDRKLQSGYNQDITYFGCLFMRTNDR